MKFSEAQMEALSQWEDNFRTAVRADWARNPGSTGLRMIYDIYTKTTGDQRRYNDNCSSCILSLLKDCGRIYFEDKQELIDRKNDAVAVELTLKDAAKVEKVPVKTAKRTAKKTK